MDILSRVGAMSGGGEGFAIVGIMSFVLASKTESFSKAVSMFGGDEFCDSDSVNVQCIGVSLRAENKG